MLSLVALATGCRHKGLVYPGTMQVVDVCFVWDNAPAADPEGMTVYFYPRSAGGKIWRYDIAGRDGGPVELPAGLYSMLAVNSDLPGVTFTGTESLESFTARARQTVGSDTIVSPTGMLYGGTTLEVEVGAEASNRVVCLPDSLGVIYNINVASITGAQRLRSATVTLAGIATAVNVATDRPDDRRCCTVTPLTAAAPLTPAASGDSVKCPYTSTTSGFGTPGGGAAHFAVTVTASLTSGKTYMRSFDVTDQVVNCMHPRNVNIYIGDIELPDGEGSGDDEDVGISVGVDGWHEIIINLPSAL